MIRSWFDPKHGALLLDEMVMASPSFRRIMEDGIVAASEPAGQGCSVAKSFSELDERLPDDLHEPVGSALTKLVVLHAIQLQHQSQREG